MSAKVIDGSALKITMRPCSHFDERPVSVSPELLVIHNISLPPATFDTPYIDDFFGGRLDCAAHPYFAKLVNVRVSAHCVIFRDGRIWQYVPFAARAWHAGVSEFQGREKCNDYSIGIELEGCDEIPFTDKQYESLVVLTRYLQQQFPAITQERIVGHQHIAPNRKTDPGPCFDWQRYLNALANESATTITSK